MKTRAYALAVLERAVKTAAQAALLVLGADQVNAMHASWADVGGFALGGFVLSVLTSLATSGFGSSDGPSVTSERIRGEAGHSGLMLAFLVLGCLAFLVVIFSAVDIGVR